MTTPVEKLKAYRTQNAAELLTVAVPEIDETWHYSPNITTRDFLKLMTHEGNGLAGAVETVLVLAVDDKGKRLFMDSNKGDVETLPPTVVIRLSNEIWKHLRVPKLEEAEKK